MNKIEHIEPIVQYPTDLVFATTHDDISSQLTILKTQSLNIANLTIQFAIIGESHCITLHRGEQFVMQEVLACTDIPDILQANSHKFAKLEAYQHQQKNYQACVWFADNLQDTLSPSQHMLKMDFPEMYGQVPFTKIVWFTTPERIQWRTIHVYPLKTKTTYVYTESYFDLIERSKND